ncbi:NAD(P)H-hydrate dehydratase [Acetivibrio thermocellus]|uniref:NAD(P)H-hydrate dehydratase n=1 Tax=Acetivibrio thermocellus TaxID=1515 RepID=UPI0021ADB230|nr:NAD(P)H-hydrate dehydratase [Acetivibrio thermocellus]UWV47216.1 NAD(P)H-hydrate dehydratase [Acetivibrio thermocellus]
MKVVTPVQMREIDSYTINKVGIPGIVLMENAAVRVTDEILKDYGSLVNKNIVLLAGKGNNGGDAFAIARHLCNKGANTVVFILAAKKDISGDARINLDILENMGVETVEVLEGNDLTDMEKRLERADLVVDGIFGTGLKGGVKGFRGNVIKLVNQKNKPVIAVDIPSGVDGETGEIEGECIKAYKTVTFGYPKFGHFLHPGCEFVGELVVADISIPDSVAQNFDIKSYVTDKETVSRLIPGRKADSNKGDYGRVLIITGSTGMTGAGCLAGTASLRSGTGLLYLGVPKTLSFIYECNLTEAVTLPLEDENKGFLTKECIPMLLEYMEKMDAVAIGPGLSTKEDVEDVVFSVVENCKVPMVIDADGLNLISRNLPVLKKARAPVVLTPHPGEMARLTGLSIGEIQKRRVGTAREFSEKWGVTTVLKGAKTVVASYDGRVFINPTGNSGMSTGGTGDVLTGIIASFIGQGLDPVDAAVAGVYLHGLCGDRVANVKGEHGLVAGDLAEEIPYAIKSLI